MKLTAYLIEGHDLEIRPADVERPWMEGTNERFAYRCLPLNIANAHGWEIVNPAGFTASWTGEAGSDAISIVADAGTKAPVVSIFGHGVLTFHITCVFRTEPGYDMLAQGPVNRPKDAIGPLAGVIETDWAPYTFTMNWLFTRARTAIRFEKGEPFCHIFPVKRGGLEDFEPEIRKMTDDPDLLEQFTIWSNRRAKFNNDLKVPESDARAEKWQKAYYRGLDTHGNEAPIDDHRTRLRLKPFVRKSKSEE